MPVERDRGWAVLGRAGLGQVGRGRGGGGQSGGLGAQEVAEVRDGERHRTALGRVVPYANPWLRRAIKTG